MTFKFLSHKRLFNLPLMICFQCFDISDDLLQKKKVPLGQNIYIYDKHKVEEFPIKFLFHDNIHFE